VYTVQAWSAHGDLWCKNLASYSGKLGGQGDREISERKGRGNEKAAGGMTRAPSVILHHWWLGEAL
jgi:hypothetical protein